MLSMDEEISEGCSEKNGEAEDVDDINDASSF